MKKEDNDIIAPIFRSESQPRNSLKNKDIFALVISLKPL
jgi:hypothetical protein